MTHFHALDLFSYALLCENGGITAWPASACQRDAWASPGDYQAWSVFMDHRASIQRVKWSEEASRWQYNRHDLRVLISLDSRPTMNLRAVFAWYNVVPGWCVIRVGRAAASSRQTTWGLTLKWCWIPFRFTPGVKAVTSPLEQMFSFPSPHFLHLISRFFYGLSPRRWFRRLQSHRRGHLPS